MTIQIRPSFEGLCNCVAIMFNTSETLQYDGSKPARQTAIIEQAYHRGADYLPNVDCECCGGTGLAPIARAA